VKHANLSKQCVPAGAHVNGDEGSVMVFTDDDEFICPNCMMNTQAEKDTCNLSI
jgi:uncharacterized protein YgiM (DUF1202 family)